MKSKSHTPWPWLTMGTHFFSIIIIFLTFALPVKSYLIPPAAFAMTSHLSSAPGIPVHLDIPKIGVHAAIESVGLTAQGNMDVPKKAANAAWFNLGPRPGEDGSAVIVGHYGHWKNGDSSVFDDLRKLTGGDVIYVEDGQGETTVFVVRETRKYDPQADAGEVFDSDDEASHLNLIACEGVWDPIAKNYSQRLVVFADRQG